MRWVFLNDINQLKNNKMKKKFIFLNLVIAGLYSSAQVRTSLYEEFTSENNGLWVPNDQVLNTVLLNNPLLVIPIKWEIPIPSAPSSTWSIYQTDKAEINWRYRSSTGSTLTAGPSTLAYGYPSQNTSTDVPTNGINTIPTGRFDGQHQWVFGAASDDPSDVSNAVITSAQTQTTNFRIAMTPSWNPTFTNCVVSATIESTTSFTAIGALMFRLCLIERLINFPSAPGINGQTNFYDVVRKSYPTSIVSGSVISMGTLLPSIWAPAQTQTLTINCNIPTYIHDLSQMAFVGFVQDDGDRKVYQAARTPQPAVPNDIKVASVNVPLSCSVNFTPTFVAQNLGAVAVTALTVAPYIDGIAQPIFNYVGNIAGGSSVTITLPSYTAAYGNHTCSITITGVSGGDLNTINNTIRGAFGISNIITSSITESFSTFPPPNWYVLNYDFNPATWGYSTTGGFGNSLGSVKYDFWDNFVDGDSDDLYLPELNLTGVSNPVLSFDVAYAQYTNQNDKLEVKISVDCGANWSNVYSKQGAILATAPSNSTSAFVPSSSQWRTENINLSSLANQPSVLVKFVATANFGNNLYIDNVNLGQPTAIKKINPNIIVYELFPNPSSDVVSIKSDVELNGSIIKVYNSLGQIIISDKIEAPSYKLNVRELTNGVYFIELKTKTGSGITKLVKN